MASPGHRESIVLPGISYYVAWAGKGLRKASLQWVPLYICTEENDMFLTMHKFTFPTHLQTANVTFLMDLMLPIHHIKHTDSGGQDSLAIHSYLPFMIPTNSPTLILSKLEKEKWGGGGWQSMQYSRNTILFSSSFFPHSFRRFPFF